MRSVAVGVLGLLAAAALALAPAASATTATDPPDPSTTLCGQTATNARIVALTYLRDTATATADPQSTSGGTPRCPNATEGTYWTDYLNAPHAVSSFAYLMNRSFVVPYLVRGAYNAFLGRTPDAAGFNYWVGVFRSSGNFAAVYAAIGTTAEAFSHAGSTTAYVTELYSYYTLSAPDAAGLQYWVSYLNNGGQRGALAYALAQRPEALGQFVGLAYELVLGRDVDAGSVGYWANVYRFVGHNELLVMALLTNSAEYRHDALTLNDADLRLPAARKKLPARPASGLLG